VICDELRIIGSTQTNVVMAAELVRVAQRALKRRPPEPRKEGLGQLVYPFDRELAWAAVTYMRTPTRVVWDVYRTRARRLEPLYDELCADIAGDPRALWRDGDGISVEARHVEEFEAGERQIVGTVKNAMIDAAARKGIRLKVDPQRPASRWLARFDGRGLPSTGSGAEGRRGSNDGRGLPPGGSGAEGRRGSNDGRGLPPGGSGAEGRRGSIDGANELVISLDLGGGSLSQRGWRSEAGPAPLREHLAAVLLMLARFDPRKDALVDPMCGAGTIAIEAVLAAKAPPRPWPPPHALGYEGAAKPAPLYPDAAPLVVGCDLDLDALAAARDNSRSAGVADAVTWQRGDVAQLTPKMIEQIASERGRPAPTTGLILSNPPYGERLDDAEVEPIYDALAVTCRRFVGWRAGFLVGNPLLEAAFARVLGRPRIKKPLANANLRAYFYLFDL